MRRKFNDLFPEVIVAPLQNVVVIDGVELSRRQMGVSQFDVTVRQVCASCNNGWLNELEARVEPTLVSFFRPTDLNVRVDDPEALALWVYVRSLLRTCTEARAHRAPVELFREVYRNRRTPKRAVIHAAATLGYEMHAGRYSWAALGNEPEAALSLHNYIGVVSFGFGSFMVQTWLFGEENPGPRKEAIRQRRFLLYRYPDVFRLIYPIDNMPAITHPLQPNEATAAGGVLASSMGLPDPMVTAWNDPPSSTD